MRYIQRILPGPVLNVCQHFFVHDPQGPARGVGGTLGKLAVTPSRGYVACQPERTNIQPRVEGDQTYILTLVDEARAVTCPACRQTAVWKDTMAQIEAIGPPRPTQPVET